MNEKYVLIKPYECSIGTLPEGTEIILFRGNFYVNGGMVAPSFKSILSKIIADSDYVKAVKINKNEF